MEGRKGRGDGDRQMMQQLERELDDWQWAYACLRTALKATHLSKMVPQDKRDGFLLALELLSHDAQDLGDLLEERIESQRPKNSQKK